jgi:uncharacterized protein with GYD domain
MAHYLFSWQFTVESAKSMIAKPIDRIGPARKLIEGFGGKIHAYYFAFGDYDGIGIVEFPDNVAVAACSMTAAASGGFSRFETTPLLTSEEARQAMAKAHDTQTGYVPPHS